LGQMGVKPFRGKAEILDLARVSPARISACQSSPTPQVPTPRIGKRTNGLANPFRIGAAHEPQAPAQALIKGPQPIISQSSWTEFPIRILEPMEIALVKAVAIESQPTQNEIEPRKPALETEGQSRH